MYQATIRASGAWDGTLRSEWNFDTVRTNSAMGSFRSMARDLDPTGDEYYDDEDSMYGIESINTEGATKGSDPPSGLAALSLNAQAAHSTVVIRSVSSPTREKDIPELLADNASSGAGSTEPSTPPQNAEDTVEPPPAYTGSVRSTRRSSYAMRNNVEQGTVLAEADLGSGVDTIRPVKKVDTVRSLRLSSDYVGSVRSRDSEGSTSPTSPRSTSSKEAHLKHTSEAAKAGRAMVDEVLVPIFERVCLAVGIVRLVFADTGCVSRRPGMTWMLVRSNH